MHRSTTIYPNTYSKFGPCNTHFHPFYCITIVIICRVRNSSDIRVARAHSHTELTKDIVSFVENTSRWRKNRLTVPGSVTGKTKRFDDSKESDGRGRDCRSVCVIDNKKLLRNVVRNVSAGRAMEKNTLYFTRNVLIGENKKKKKNGSFLRVNRRRQIIAKKKSTHHQHFSRTCITLRGPLIELFFFFLHRCSIRCRKRGSRQYRFSLVTLPLACSLITRVVVGPHNRRAAAPYGRLLTDWHGRWGGGGACL